METTHKVKKSERAAHTRIKQLSATVNRQFRIKVYGFIQGRKIDHLVGVSGLISLIGLNNALVGFNRALDTMEDKCTCKFRRGVAVTFYRK